MSRSEREDIRDRILAELLWLSWSFRLSESRSDRSLWYRLEEFPECSEGRLRDMYGGVLSLPLDGVRGRGGLTTGKGNSVLLGYII